MSDTPPPAGPRRPIAHILDALQCSLDAFNRLLSEPLTKAELFKCLHDGSGLPDKEISASADRIVDLLGSMEHLLEPGALKLADHFLGQSDVPRPESGLNIFFLC